MRHLMWIVALLALAGGAALSEESGRLTVTGEGRVAVAPDMATVRFGVTVREKTAQAALAAASRAMEKVLARVREAGIAPRDIRTDALSLSPLWSERGSGQTRRITGYVAGNQLTVRVRDLPSLGGLLDAVTASGANTFNGLSLALSDPGPALDEARRRAVADAMARARLYAEAAGVRLGALLELSETGGLAPPVRARQMAMAAEAVPVAEGELVVRAGVTMVFAILPAR